MTFGGYGIWWLGASWPEMKVQLQDARMRPFWHALASLVPIYQFFRINAHYRALNEMLRRVRACPGMTTLHHAVDRV